MNSKSKFKSQYSFLFEEEYSENVSFSEIINQDEDLQNKTKIIINNKKLPAGNSISSLEQAVTFLILGDIVFSNLAGIDSLLLASKSTSSIRSLTSTEGISIQTIMTNPDFKNYQSIYKNYKERILNDTALLIISKLFSASVLFLGDSNFTHVLLEQKKKIKINRSKLKYVINLSSKTYISEKEINANKIIDAIHVNLIKTINVI